MSMREKPPVSDGRSSVEAVASRWWAQPESAASTRGKPRAAQRASIMDGPPAHHSTRAAALFHCVRRYIALNAPFGSCFASCVAAPAEDIASQMGSFFPRASK